MRSRNAQHIGERHDPGHPDHIAWVVAVGARIDDDEAAAAGVVLADQSEAARRLVVAFDDDMLQQIAKTGLDRALVAAVDVEVVGDSTLLADFPVRLDEHHTRRVAEFPARGLELHQRRQPRLAAGELVFAFAHAAQAILVFGSCRDQFRFARRRLEPDLLERRFGMGQRRSRLGLRRIHRFLLTAKVIRLDIKLGERLSDTLPLRAPHAPSRAAGPWRH